MKYKQCTKCLENKKVSELFRVVILEGQLNLICNECGFGIVVLRSRTN